MTRTILRVDRANWESAIDGVAQATPGLVPVAKGNGYGFGLANLADQAERIGADTIAVGTADEIAAVRDVFSGDIVVLNPWFAQFPSDPRVIPTVSRLTDLEALAQAGERPRVLVEIATSMRRHGIDPSDLNAAARVLDQLDFAGWVIHLPLGSHRDDHARLRDEALGLAATATVAAPGPIWLSHVTAAHADEIGDAVQQPTRLRLGTALWLGEPRTFGAISTVLDVHPVRRGERVGYRQRKSRGDGWVVVVTGGTAHGIALSAPSAAATWRQRAATIVTALGEAFGRSRSPFTIDGQKRWFVEPPHMQSSLVFLPAGARPPQIGDEIEVTVRNTTYLPDAVQFD